MKYRLITALFALASISCGTVDTGSTHSFPFSLPSGNEKQYQFVDRDFMLVPGDTALFYGMRSCTTIVNGSITSLMRDSSYFRTITGPIDSVSVDGLRLWAYPQRYQTARSIDKLDSNTIVRYFTKRDSGIIQLAFSADGHTTTIGPAERKIVPNIFDAGSFASPPPTNTWTTSSLVPNPLIVKAGRTWLTCTSVCTKAVGHIGMDAFACNGVFYRNGIVIRTYCSLSGFSTDPLDRFDYLGTLIIDRSYFKNIGLVVETGTLTIEKKRPDNSVELIRETFDHKRGPEGARIYPDTAGIARVP